MPLQNRVTPTGEILADPARGAVMGNRGILHDGERRLGEARWRHRAWIACRPDFGGRRRSVMAPGRYTELFFLDEATAFAAGHRPCAECRRAAFLGYRDALATAEGAAPLPAAALDARLHAERTSPRTRAQRRHRAPFDGLPDGAFVLDGDAPSLVVNGTLRSWSFSGYGPPRPLPRGEAVLLTPPTSLAALGAGYRPQIDASAVGAAGG